MFDSFKRKFGFSEISLQDFSRETHHVYYEYFYDDSGKWLARFYDHDTNQVCEGDRGAGG